MGTHGEGEALNVIAWNYLYLYLYPRGPGGISKNTPGGPWGIFKIPLGPWGYFKIPLGPWGYSIGKGKGKGVCPYVRMSSAVPLDRNAVFENR